MSKKAKIYVGFALFFLCLVVFLVPAVGAPRVDRTGFTKLQESQEYLEMINSVYNYVLQNYVEDVDPEILYRGAMEGMLNALEDPYTQYLDMSQQRTITDTTAGQFGGVGLTITKSEYIEVTNPIEGTPGWRAGIQIGDLIIKIGETDTKDLILEDAVSLLRGEPGTDIEVTIRRGDTMEFNVVLTRELIEVPTVKYGFIPEAPGKTGLLRIIEFTPLTSMRVQEALDYFIENNFTSLILDLRDNPGGVLSSVEEVANKFIDEGVIVSTRGRKSYYSDAYYASPIYTTMPKNIPVVVLINGGSASASEILAGALKDTKSAYLVGQNTYGKGSVQEPRGLPYEDGFKLTIAKYYSPSGANIDEVGIPPDETVNLPGVSVEEQQIYVDLMNSNKIYDFANEHKDVTEKEIEEFAEKLYAEYPLEKVVLRRLIRIYSVSTETLYDLDYDTQLQRAIEIANSQDFYEMLEKTKTLLEIEEEKIQEVAEEESTLTEN
ncbi:MAG: S41 family peptidase [Treponemataceae bacterium]|nr:S41 family peptidase [Treponemataceae bacterium]